MPLFVFKLRMYAARFKNFLAMRADVITLFLTKTRPSYQGHIFWILHIKSETILKFTLHNCD